MMNDFGHKVSNLFFTSIHFDSGSDLTQCQMHIVHAWGFKCLLKSGPWVCLKKVPTKRDGQLWVG
jgi:hypothetical protein